MTCWKKLRLTIPNAAQWIKKYLTNWRTPALIEFEKRANCVGDEYSSFEATLGTKLNGNLTLGENTADNGGTRIALMAYQNLVAASGKSSETVDGFTPEQRFFIAYGQVWCSSWTPQLIPG